MRWNDVRSMIGEPGALATKFINWRGEAQCPRKAWIITTLDGPRNKLVRPDRYLPEKRQLHLSDEKIEPAARRMLESQCSFPLYVVYVGGGRPVPYSKVGMARGIKYDVSDEAFPHWVIDLTQSEEVEPDEFR